MARAELVGRNRADEHLVRRQHFGEPAYAAHAPSSPPGSRGSRPHAPGARRGRAGCRRTPRVRLGAVVNVSSNWSTTSIVRSSSGAERRAQRRHRLVSRPHDHGVPAIAPGRIRAASDGSSPASTTRRLAAAARTDDAEQPGSDGPGGQLADQRSRPKNSAASSRSKRREPAVRAQSRRRPGAAGVRRASRSEITLSASRSCCVLSDGPPRATRPPRPGAVHLVAGPVADDLVDAGGHAAGGAGHLFQRTSAVASPA